MKHLSRRALFGLALAAPVAAVVPAVARPICPDGYTLLDADDVLTWHKNVPVFFTLEPKWEHAEPLERRGAGHVAARITQEDHRMNIITDTSAWDMFVAEVVAYRPDIGIADIFTRSTPIFSLVAAPASGDIKISLIADQQARARFESMRARNPPPS